MKKGLNILLIICLAAFMSCQKEDLTPVSQQKMASDMIDLDDVQINYGGSDHDDDGINYGGNDHDDEGVKPNVLFQQDVLENKKSDLINRDGSINYGGSDHDEEEG